MYDPDLEHLKLSELEEVLGKNGDKYNCLAVIQSLQTFKFSKCKALQVTLCDRTLSDFNLMYWGKHYDIMRGKLRTGDNPFTQLTFLLSLIHI